MTDRPAPDIRVFPDLASLSHAAAELVLSTARQSVASHGRFSLALSGGSTPRTLYSLFAEQPWRETMPWSGIHLFWVDERCVPSDHADSNYHLAAVSFLERVSLPAGNVHRIRGEEGPDRAAAGYEQDLLAFFGSGMPVFDLVLLGVGEDGHTASLFPRSAQLLERRHRALPVHLEGAKRSRVTLSLPVLNSASNVFFLVSGASKAGVMREVLEQGAQSELPSAQVQPVRGNVVWMLDREATGDVGAALLPVYAREKR